MSDELGGSKRNSEARERSCGPSERGRMLGGSPLTKRPDGDESKTGGSLPDAIADAVLSAFEALPKTGKPQPHESTVLAGFAIVIGGAACDREPPRVVSLGAGTKCLGASKRSSKGDVLNDSHAEVIARRALLGWLYTELQSALDAHQTQSESAAGSELTRLFQFRPQDCRFAQAGDWELHMFVTQTPCGDASIYASEGGNAVRTGAKEMVPGGEVPQAGQVEHTQTVGGVRRKPGKGDATLSMSCSDKLAKWALLGVQGALLDSLLAQPLHFRSLTIGLSPTVYASHYTAAAGAAKHAIVGRTSSIAKRLPTEPPAVSFAAVQLPTAAIERLGLLPSEARRVLSGVSLNWSARSSVSWPTEPCSSAPLTRGDVAEVTLAASGRKAGTAKKGAGWSSPKTRSALCRAAFWERFQSLVNRTAMLRGEDRGSFESHGNGSGDAFAIAGSLYWQRKASSGYRKMWGRLLEAPSVFEAWIQKDDSFLEF